jgi:DNA-binding winged helix-turn-helix (wHTH) protein/tetratricopeptide (TPR) repeat protein
MLKLRDLAVRSDFQIGSLHVSPSRRLVEGPAGSIHLQPLIMQAFLLLLDADGDVVTRDQLFDQCWGGNLVGNESLNRVMARVKHIPAEVAPGFFEIETIPRTGYRISGDILPLLQSTPPSNFSRRALFASSAAAITAAGAVGIWLAGRSGSDREFERLMKEAQAAVRKLRFDDGVARTLEKAVAIRPKDAKAWGLLALVRSLHAQSLSGAPEESPSIPAAEEAIRKALSIDPRESNALLAMFELQGSTLDLATRDRKLRHIIGLDPSNVIAITELVGLLQSAGLNAESWSWNERALRIEPLSADLLGRRALKLWIAGRVAEADKVVDQVRALYPADGGTWWVRFLILALTDRAQAALAMLKGEPKMLDPALATMWEACLPALDQQSAMAIRTARNACLDAARKAGELAAHAVMILAALGEVDASFEIADGFLLWRGKIVRQSEGSKEITNDAAWRNGVQWLFTPPCASMRRDPRFLALCYGIGLTEYWRSRGVRPDYLTR